MFSTSLVAAVTGLMAVGSMTQPNWQTSYRAALAQAAEQHKPVAVFIAAGGNGQTTVVSEGALGSDAAEVLRSNYVALYVDASTPTGSTLASSFGMSKGLVISDRTGGVQALRHEGTVTQTDLAGYLKRFSQPQTVATTEQHAAVVAAPVLSAPVAAPVTLSAPVYAPVGYSPFLQPAVGGCPNGRCPLAR